MQPTKLLNTIIENILFYVNPNWLEQVFNAF